MRFHGQIPVAPCEGKVYGVKDRWISGENHWICEPWRLGIEGKGFCHRSLNWAQIGDLFGRRSYATLRGLMGVSYGVATFCSPIYAGWIFDRTGSYGIVLLTFSLVLAIASILFIGLHRRVHAKSP